MTNKPANKASGETADPLVEAQTQPHANELKMPKDERAFDLEESLLKDGLDVVFYKSWYNDLATFDNDTLRNHWNVFGKKENRHPNLNSVIKSKKLQIEDLPENFDPFQYIALNNDLGLPANSPYQAVIHYLENGQFEKRSYFFDTEFYRLFYKDLINLQDDSLKQHYQVHGIREKRVPNLEVLIKGFSSPILERLLDESFTLKDLINLNPDLEIKNFKEIIISILRQDRFINVKLFSNPSENLDFYSELALSFEKQGEIETAKRIYRIALVYGKKPKILEHLGNIAFNSGHIHLAAAYYKESISLGSKSKWAFLNLIECYNKLGETDEIFNVIHKAHHSINDLDLEEKLKNAVDQKWIEYEAERHLSATLQQRERLMEVTHLFSKEYSDKFKKFYLRFSADKPHQRLNENKILIVGDFHVDQCVRYRITQKAEQLQHIGYEVEKVSWTEKVEKIERKTFLSDIIIFYRCPATPPIIRIIEKSKALGKLTFYEIDDLIFEKAYPPPIESYGGSVDPFQYTELTKGFPLFREAAKLCHYGIASTLPLLNRLEKFVVNKKCFLHRNALDSVSISKYSDSLPNKSYIDIFYGTATLAHNSDFIQIALPVLERLLDEYPNVRLILIGHLTINSEFLKKYTRRIIKIPLIKDPQAYLTMLASADINLAVLDSDEINDCKSELKWVEAGSLTIPSVVSNTKNYIDVVEQGVNGFIASNADDWYKYLKLLIENEPLRLKMGQKVYSDIQERYNIEHMAANMHMIIKESLQDFYQRK